MPAIGAPALAHPALASNEFGLSSSSVSSPRHNQLSAGPGEHARTEVPLRLLALQQRRADTNSVPTRRPASRQRSTNAARGLAGGAHAAAGSPSPERGRLGLEPTPSEPAAE